MAHVCYTLLHVIQDRIHVRAATLAFVSRAVRPAELETYEISRQIFDEQILFHVKHSLAHVSNILFHVKQNLHWPSEPHSGTRGASRAALAMRKH